MTGNGWEWIARGPLCPGRGPGALSARRCPRGLVGWAGAQPPTLPTVARPAVLPSRARLDPDPAGGLPVPRRAAAGSSTSARPRACAPRLSSYFQDIGNLHPRTATMVTTGGERRVDGRRHRGRGAAAGVLLDQGVRPAVQRQVPRRQVLPVARGHGGRGVPAGDGRARRQAQGHPLLRPLQPRLGDPRDRRPAAAGLPDALVQQRRLQAVRRRSAGPACSATSTSARRPCVGSVSAEEHREIVDDFCDFMAGNTDGVRQAPRARDVRRLRGAGLREGRPAARRPRRAAPRRWRSRRWCSATAPTPT